MSEDEESLSPENINTEADEAVEEETIPDYVCGVVVYLNKNGGGTTCNAIHDNVERDATVDDILMMLSHVINSINSQVTASSVFNIMERFRAGKMVNPNFGKKLRTH